MAAQVVFQEQTVKAIADAIRAKIGSSNSIAGRDFASLIDGIEVGGGVSFSMGTYTPTETSVWVRSGSSYHKLGAGQTYKWLAIGGLS